MKKTITSLFLCSLFFAAPLFSQEMATMNVNNVKVTVNSNGALFWDGQNGQFIAPFQQGQPELSTMKASGIWLAGVDPGGNLKGAVQLYNDGGKADFQPGTLDSDSGPEDLLKGIYRVTSQDIANHLADLSDNGVIDNPNPAVFGWPANGNTFFSDYHAGEQLPNTFQGLAGFYDSSGDGVYNPNEGDFPVTGIRGCEYIQPDEILWYVFNDETPHTQSGMNSVRMEIQATVFAYNCTEKPLANTIFVKYKLINRAFEDIDAMYFGVFSDFDIGNSEDDFFGSDPNRSLVFAYNGDNNDEGGYGANAPVMALQLFRGPLNESGQEIPLKHVMPIEGVSLINPIDYYHLLTGHLADGSPAPNNGIYYPGNPAIPVEWSEVSDGNTPGDRSVLSSYGPFILQPGAVNELMVGYTFYQEIGNSPLQNVALMYSQADDLLGVFGDCVDPSPIVPCTANTTPIFETKQPHINLFPNPASNYLIVEMAENQLDRISIITVGGNIVLNKNIEKNSGEKIVELDNLPTGFYLFEGISNGIVVVREKLVVIR